MKIGSNFFWTIFLLAAIGLTGGLAIIIGQPRIVETVGKGGGEDLDLARVRDDIGHLAASGSRMTGYPEAWQAGDYILKELDRLHISAANREVEEFEVASPIVERATLSAATAQGKVQMRLHPLWPNLARTCQTGVDGLHGPLVDLGQGNDRDLNGKDLHGAIVVLDWDSQAQWLNAAELGIAGVIFRATGQGCSSTAQAKYLSVPANMPRFYVKREDVPALNQLLTAPAGPQRPDAIIQCAMKWQRVKSRNILARIGDEEAALGKSAGRHDPDRAPVIFHAYYDSVSVVPELAPGAEQACGAAALLELGRYFAHLPEKPRRPVYLLFTGGHGEALAGMTHFIKRLKECERRAAAGAPGGAPDASLTARMGTPGLFVGLDLSTGSSQLGLFCQGHFREQLESYLRPRFSSLALQLAQFAASYQADPASAPARPGFVDCVNLTFGLSWTTFLPYRAPLESEIPTINGYPGVTISTIKDERQFVDTPEDTVDRLRMDLLADQLTAKPGERAGLGNLARALAFWKGPYIGRELDDQSAVIQGRVTWLNQKKSVTPDEPLNEALVFLKRVVGDKALLGTHGISPVLSNAHGEFEFRDLVIQKELDTSTPSNLEAYCVADVDFAGKNPEAEKEFARIRAAGGMASGPGLERNGEIIYALDMARPDEYPFSTFLTGRLQTLNLVLFPCKAITLYGLTYPRGYMPLTNVDILETSTKSPPFQYGISKMGIRGEGRDEYCATIWAAPSLKAYLCLGQSYLKNLLVLVNNSPRNPVGDGFVLDRLNRVPSMSYQGVTDMWNLDQWRIEKLQSNGINNPRVAQAHREASTYLEKIHTAWLKHDYTSYWAAAENAWSSESKAYDEILSITNNMIKGVLFYLVLLLPFAYCLERLLIAAPTVQQRAAWMVMIFCIAFGVLACVHPAFRFTMTPLIVLLAFGILALAGTVGILVVVRFDAFLQARRQDASGLHEDSSNVGNIAIRAIDLGIANIRRRPQRGLLTGMTIVFVTFTLLSFTSIVPETNISRLKHPKGNPARRGLLIRHHGWSALPDPLYASIQREESLKTGRAKGEIALAARAWFFADKAGFLSRIDLVTPSASGQPSRAFNVSALLCLEPAEKDVSDIDKTLIAGRWFKDENELAVILPEYAASMLGYGPRDIGRPVRILGQEMPLIGIYDEKKMNQLQDLDGEPLAPADFFMQALTKAHKKGDEVADTLEDYVHLPASQVAIVPLGYGRRLGAGFRSVALKLGPSWSPAAEAEKFTRRSNQTILASQEGLVTLFSAIDISSFSATREIAIPVLLGFLVVFGTMLGSVYERRREIFVYNSVGLSPTNVAALFLAESSVYAIVGACIGYLMGQVISKILLVTGALSGLSLNYSAGSTVFVAVLTMVIVLVSTLYPARQAFLAAMPETQDQSQGEEAYATDHLDFYLPFVATPGSIFGMQAYMHEYLESVLGASVGQFATDDLRLGLECMGGRPVPALAFRGWLAPFDLGISHDVTLRIAYREDTCIYQYHMSVARLSGDQQNWRRLMPRFIRLIRKQLLMWRILTPEDQNKYCTRGKTLYEAVELNGSRNPQSEHPTPTENMESV